MNGTALKLASSQAAWPKLSAFSRLDIGYEEWHLNDAKQVWIDDIAVSSRLVGCN
jgi:hypothetical protein